MATPHERVSGVVFDWYETLAAPNPGDFWDRLPALIADAGGDPGHQSVALWATSPLDHRQHSVSEEAYRAWQYERLADLLDRCAVVDPGRRQILDEIEGLRYNRVFTVFPEVPDVLRELRSRGLLVGLCSNWDWDLRRQLVHNHIDELFDVVISSAVVGYRKPHPAIFEILVDKMGEAPRELVFVGDTWDHDVMGARHAGLRPVHVSRSPCAVGDHDEVVCVDDLTKVLAVVDA